MELIKHGARGGTRTPILFRGLAPKASASTNSATLARRWSLDQSPGFALEELRRAAFAFYFKNLTYSAYQLMAQPDVLRQAQDERIERRWPASRGHVGRRLVGRQGLEP